MSALIALGLILATCPACFAVPERPTAPSVMPTVIQAPGGPVRIQRTRDIVVDGDSAWGAFYEQFRLIRVDTTGIPEFQLRVLYHELTHAALHDAGLEDVIPPTVQEAICNAIATARMAELRGVSIRNP